MSKFGNAKYASELEEKWGNTSAYKESLEKTANYKKEKWDGVISGMDDIFALFASCKKIGESIEGDMAKSIVKRLQEYITANFYHCTDEILAGLGQMYVCDGRFKNSIDSYGEGTAEYASKAIKEYCKKLI